MALDRGDQWFGYAPATVKSHKYSVKYHPKLGRRVACTVVDRKAFMELTLFSPEPHPEIEDHIPDGGPFFVNEWKQILKPVMGEDGYREVVYLGEFPDLHFRFRFQGHDFDNAKVDGLSPGDPWPHQEAGMQYAYDLTRGVISRELVRWEDFAGVRQIEELSGPPEELMKAFQVARPGRRSGRFYINEHGVVLLPRTEEEDDSPVYVGRVAVGRDSWFEKYEGDAV